ncbi:MAG: hypothetical protein ACRD2U_15120 [Terriglobales bacterium]
MKRSCQSLALILFVLSVALHGNGKRAAQQNPTLADVLKQEKVPLPPAPIPRTDSRITSYAILNDDQEFLIAYYLDNPQNELRFPLLLTRFDKRTRKWSDKELTGIRMNVFGETGRGIEDDCLGSVLSIVRNNKWYCLNLHFNPSAGCLLILNRNLTVSQALGGWVAAFFNSGVLIYSGDMVHFADVHPETLFLYDPAKHKSLQIYPQKRDPFRDDFSTRLEKAINRKRCSESNLACEPHRFTSHIDSVEVNDETKSLAFHASFETEGFLTREQAESNDKWYDDDYVYIYRIHPLQWREFSIYDLKATFGTDSLKMLLTPGKLKEVFSTPAP